MANPLYAQHLTQRQLNALIQYKYKGEDRSITYKYVMGPFYNWLINYIPTCLAPNAITLIGFALITITHIILMYHAPHFDEQAPRYVYVLSGISLFCYMVLDNLDGKQARRTNSSSPLGQLFDHGCDALNVTLSGMSMLATCQLRAGSMSMSLLFFLGHLMLFCATLEEYHTGAMVLRELNGPNEGLLTLVVLQILTGLIGPSIWSIQIPIPYTNGFTAPLNHVTYFSGVVPTLTSVVGNAWGITQFNRRNGKTFARAFSEVAAEFISVIVFGIIFNSWTFWARAHFERQTIWIMWLSGGVMFDLISRMMLAHLAKAPYPYFPRLFWPTIVCFLNAVAAQAGWDTGLSVDGLTRVVVLGTGVYNLWRVWCLVSQLCEFLNVRCFRLGPLCEEKEEKKEEKKE